MQKNYARVAVLAGSTCAAFVCALVYMNGFRHPTLPRWDEPQHMLFAWQIRTDLVDRNVSNFLRDSYAQLYWPFLHSWWVSAFLLVFGVTDSAARLSSFAAMVIAIILAFEAGRMLRREDVPWTGLMAVSLLLMPKSLSGLATHCMTELPALMMSFLALTVYIRAEQLRTATSYALFGCALGGTFLTRYDCGLVLILAFIVVAVTEVLWNRAAFHTRQALFVLTPLAVVSLIWLIVPQLRLAPFFKALVNRPSGPQGVGLTSIAFYSTVLYSDFGWSTMLFLFAVCYAAGHLEDRMIRLLFAACVLYAGIAAFHHSRTPRHIYPLYPALILLTAFGLTSSTRSFLRSPSLRATFLSLVIAGMFVRAAGAAARPQLSDEREPVRAEIAAYVVEEVKDARRVFVVGESPPLSAYLIAWELRKRGNRAPVSQSGDFKRALVGGTASASGAGKPVEVSALVEVLTKLSVDTVIAIGLRDTSPFYDKDYNVLHAWSQPYVERLQSVSEYKKGASRKWAAVGMSLDVYRATR